MGFSDRKIAKRALVALALLLGVFSVSALAHDGDKGRASEYGREQGYEDGVRHGREDDQRGSGYDLKSDEYKKAERGYRKEYGSKGDYKKGYKQGYEQGYSEGYRGGYSQQSRIPGSERRDRDRRDRDDDYRRDRDDDDRRDRDRNRRGTRADDFGARQGEQDGYLKGREDRDRNRDFDVERHSDYRKADRGYKREFGDKEDYRDGYRQGFRRTYDDGYGGRGNSRRSGNSGWSDILGGIFRRP
ncbi:MAG: hypothetical protein ACR2L2_01780 [Acidobacteriota bacterium]